MIVFLKPTKVNDSVVLMNQDGSEFDNTDKLIRKGMIELALNSNQCIQLDTKSFKTIRKSINFFNNVETTIMTESTQKTTTPVESNAVMAFIHSSPELKPKDLIVSDLKWKYLVRSIVRGRNVMMLGDAGSGKTMAAMKVAAALGRKMFSFNMGSSQDPRSTLIGNTHFKKETGTVFNESLFVKAIQTKDAVILLDELSRAHPDAWNILMSVLDVNQRYLRLDEHENSPTVKVAEGVSFVSTANIGNQYTATRVLDRALLDRFTIIEMDLLTKDQEFELLKMKFPNLPDDMVNAITEIASMTRLECRMASPKLSTSLSTRVVVELAGVLSDGFTLNEAAEVCIYPFFDADGGVDSERTFARQIVQKFAGDSRVENIFNTFTPEEVSF
jgi:nitric oxide reductase NorQ protein